MPASLIPPDSLPLLRTALAGFTVDAMRDLLGPSGGSALARGDLSGVAYALPTDEPLATLVRLFLLGHTVQHDAAAAALAALGPHAPSGLLEVEDGLVRALVEVRPYGEDGAGSEPWWVVSDFGSDVRPGPLRPDHVLGVGAASTLLAQATPRSPVNRALDIGTGCGVQALHLARHAVHVTATDVSERALRLAATTAALSGHDWTLRHGSLLEPVAGQRFDQVVANPPFVVSPGFTTGSGGYDYRDSGLAGDAVCAALLQGIPELLAPGGTASLLANWIVDAEQSWTDRVAGWLAGRGCDAWVWQREVAEPGEYVGLWLRDAGEVPGTARWSRLYEHWLDWFGSAGVLAVGMGLVTLWRTDRADPVVVCEDVPQAVEQPVGVLLPDWIERHRWLADTGDPALLRTRFRCTADLVRTRAEQPGPDGWRTARITLGQGRGMRWEVEADELASRLVGGCDGSASLASLLDVLGAAYDADSAGLRSAALPVVRDLVGRGFLEPVPRR